MTKLLSLGAKLKYPVTIIKVLKKPGDSIKKLDPILQYKWNWTLMVGDPSDPKGQWPEEQVAIADWESPVEGTLKSWKVKDGQVIHKNMDFVEVEETCPHSIQYKGMCGLCGKDMTEINWTSATDDTERAKINMIHDQTSLKVSQDEASKAESELQKRLLAHKKLSLVVDLDQTIIHACIEPTVGEWQRDKSSPNYEAVKDVRSFQLNDDGPRGLASGCWYYIKMRPGLKEFLAKISELYELHVYTMGTRAYAVNIAKIVDPDKKLFGDRIISRDENGNVTAKSLARLFPVDTKMVVIIDDRADVWPNNRPNLIKVVPYDFFLGIGDINSSFLPKREELPPMQPPPLKKKSSKSELKDAQTSENAEASDEKKPESDEVKPVEAAKPEAAKPDDGSKISALEELVRMGSGDDQALRLEQAAEQEKFLEKQLTDRPLLHMQEKLDKEDNAAPVDEAANGGTAQEPQHRHNLLVDNDVELKYLEQHLTQLHKAFYDEYEGRVINASGGRVAQLKPGLNRKMPLNGADRKVVPDIGEVMPRLKSKTLAGCTIVMSGLVPLQADIMRTEIGLQAASFGADIQSKVNRKVTHLVASTSRTRTHKVRQAAKYPNIKIVNQQWLLNSMSKWQKEDETPYLVTIHEADRVRDDGFNSDAPSSIGDSEESSEDSASEDEDRESVPASSQDETADDDEGVMPDEIQEGTSPIDNLKGFDWGGVDDELDEFMASDSEANESGNESDVSRQSTSSQQSKAGRGRKRNHDTVTEDEESDEESTLAKKQRIAKTRTTGLNAVKTPNNTSALSQDITNLPTPGEEEDASDDGFGDDLEADLEAAFASEELEAQGADGST